MRGYTCTANRRGNNDDGFDAMLGAVDRVMFNTMWGANTRACRIVELQDERENCKKLIDLLALLQVVGQA
jgi:hypothetical protein